MRNENGILNIFGCGKRPNTEIRNPKETRISKRAPPPNRRAAVIHSSKSISTLRAVLPVRVSDFFRISSFDIRISR
jgi:hypothetical protein